MENAWVLALVGGVIIGVAVSLLLFLNGRVTGISGIVYGLLVPRSQETSWRVSFLIGLLLGGVVLSIFKPEVFGSPVVGSWWVLVLAGGLVGFGTVLGSGCTSGHGVCGISRFSIRSILATITFIMSGVVAVSVFKMLGVYL